GVPVVLGTDRRGLSGGVTLAPRHNHCCGPRGRSGEARRFHAEHIDKPRHPMLSHPHHHETGLREGAPARPRRDSGLARSKKVVVTLYLASIVGRRGVTEVLEPEMSDEEREGLRKSEKTLKKALARVRDKPTAKVVPPA